MAESLQQGLRAVTSAVRSFRWGNAGVTVPLVPTHSKFDKLLVEDNTEAGGGPMGEEFSIDERGKLLDGEQNGVAAEGLAERMMSRLFTTRGLAVCVLLITAVLCLGTARGAYGVDNSSLATRVSEYMLHGAGQSHSDINDYLNVEHNIRKHHSTKKVENVKDGDDAAGEAASAEDEKYRRVVPATMPHDDDGRAQRAFDLATKGKKSAAVEAALGHDRVVVLDDDEGASSGGSKRGGAGGRRGKGGGEGVSSSNNKNQNQQGRRHAPKLGRGRYRVKAEAANEEFRAISDEQLAAQDDDNGEEEEEEEEEEEQRLQIIRPTRMEHGATHKEALEQLEASIRDTVKAAHRTSSRQSSKKRGGRG